MTRIKSFFLNIQRLNFLPIRFNPRNPRLKFVSYLAAVVTAATADSRGLSSAFKIGCG
jgi:hypothetical protein